MKTPLVVWIQCTPRGKPIFATASPSKSESRSLLRTYLYPGENLTWAEIRAEGSMEKRFKVEEMQDDDIITYHCSHCGASSRRFVGHKAHRCISCGKAGGMKHAGKLGPWARLGAEGVRYLATDPQKQPIYRRILSAEKEGDNWRYLQVCLEGEVGVRSCWCGTNVYEEA